MKKTSRLLMICCCVGMSGCGDNGEDVMRDLTAALDRFASDIEKADDKQSAQKAVDQLLSQLDTLVERKQSIGGELKASVATQEAFNEAGERATAALGKAEQLTENPKVSDEISAKLKALN